MSAANMTNSHIANPLSNLGEQSELPHGLKGLMAYPFSLPPWLFYSLIFFLIFLCLFLCWYFLYFRKKNKPELEPENPLIILKREIRAFGLIEKAGNKELQDYFFSLNMLFRRILEQAFKFPATDLTLKELIAPINAQMTLSASEKENIIKFLKRTELIKFADAKSDLLEAKESYEKVLQWSVKIIDQTLAQNDLQESTSKPMSKV